MKTQTQKKWVGLLATIALTAILAGCASSYNDPLANRARAVRFEPWVYRERAAQTARSEHYAIHTTIEDREFIENLATLMEGALQQYQLFAPGVKVSADPMECYVFARRPEWAEFTANKTGSDAALYLQINRGGYTVRDWYVAYFIGDIGTYAVAAHEGWHQYVARHFKSRLPPFLEEGIATMFENVRFFSSPPKWDLSPSSHRAEKLRAAMNTGNLWPLDKLITMHAGEVVSLPGARIEAFYAQNWAFAEFLWEAEGGKYRPALQRLLTDCANGTVYPGATARRSVLEGWNPQTVKPMLEHYLCMDLASIDRAYQSYMREIAFPKHGAFGAD